MKPKSNRKPGPMDNCQTPPYAIEPLLDRLWSWQRYTIWECAAGEGIMARALEEKGYRVICSDIDPKATLGFTVDFLESQVNYWDLIVTNPPYSLKFEWLERCYRLGKPFALLLPIDTHGAQAAQRLFALYGITTLYMSPRVDFKMPEAGWLGSGAQFATAWFLGGGLVPEDERNMNFYYRLEKMNKHDLHALDEAGELHDRFR
jgi:hypothetical protein